MWRTEFDGLVRDKTRPSRIKPLSAEAAERVVALTLCDPPGETTHWTGASMAKAAGLSVSSVQRIWRAHGLQPHRMRQFKLSNDPRFVDKLRDVVGLYVDPPAHAIVLSVDEKSQIQALDRTQPGLPLKKGRAGTMTHDYERHGTTTLFAAMNVLDGTVIGRNMQRHRHQDMFADGSNAIRDGRSISPRHRLPGSTPSRASSQPSQSAGSSAASFAPSPTCKPPSTASSKSTISNRRPSPGPPIQTKSSPQSGAGTKCSIRSTRIDHRQREWRGVSSQEGAARFILLFLRGLHS